tara:strand:- start:200 stop:751 length:552 start_codon:yes stop_codon:yes gene_type:complete
MSILMSITYPSLKRYFIQQERNSYVAKLNSFLELIKRETRRYGISCDLKTTEIINFKSESNSNKNDIAPFQVNCYGSDEIINKLRFEVPKITKNIFQLVSGELTFTPKGQVYVRNGNNLGNSYLIVVGLKERTNGFTDSLRCLLVTPPTGVIKKGIYPVKYQTKLNYKVSGNSSYLMGRLCAN